MQKLIQASFDKMKELLFPFNLNHWLKILLIIWLAGVADSGGGFQGLGNFNKAKSVLPEKPTVVATTPATATSGAGMSNPSIPLPELPNKNPTLKKMQAEPSVSDQKPTQSEKIQKKIEEVVRKYWPWVLVLVLMVGLPFVILSSWINARFEFILLDFLVHKNLAIRQSFAHNKILGNSLFKFNLLFLLIMIAAGGCLIGLFFLGPVGIVLGVILILVGLLALVVAMLVINDFVLPLMYHQNLKIRDAAQLFWNQDFDLGQIFLYYLVKIGLGIVASIAQGILFVIILIALGIPTGIVFLLILGMIKIFSVLKLLGIILMVVGGVIAILAVIAALGLAVLPIHIFFQCLRLNFVTKLLPDYHFFNQAGELSGLPA